MQYALTLHFLKAPLGVWGVKKNASAKNQRICLKRKNMKLGKPKFHIFILCTLNIFQSQNFCKGNAFFFDGKMFITYFVLR